MTAVATAPADALDEPDALDPEFLLEQPTIAATMATPAALATITRFTTALLRIFYLTADARRKPRLRLPFAPDYKRRVCCVWLLC